MLRTGVIAIVAATALAPAAGASASLTPSQYRAQASAICTEAKTRIAAIQPKNSVSRAQGVAFLNARLGLLKEEYLSLRALQPPRTFAAKHTKILWDMWTMFKADAQTVQLIQRGAGDPYTIISDEMRRTMNTSGDIFFKWEDLGVTSCEGVGSYSIGFSGK